MADQGLFALYQLHLVDEALYEIKQRASALDVGRAEAAKIKELEADPDGVLGTFRGLENELNSLEMDQQALDTKIKKIDSEIYGGKVVNPREIAALEKDKSAALDKRAENDARILELWEEIPVAKVVAHTVLEDISKLKLAIAEKQRSAKAEHERLQSDFKAWAAKRPSAFKAVPARLVEQYEKLRVKLDVGMAMVTTDHRCGSCGMHVPEKAFEHISEDRVVQCENCRRILFRLQQG